MFPFVPINGTHKIFPTRKVLDDLPEQEVKRHCGMSNTAVKQLLPYFEHLKSERVYAIPLKTQLLAYLSYLRSGGFQWCVGSLAGVSQSSASRIIEKFTDSLFDQCSDFIYFPSAVEERNIIKQGFYSIKGFPNVIGAVDGTHVGIKAPVTNSFAFVNRKQYHSVNVQVICDHNYVIQDVVARWPGSTHDSFIWRNSSIKTRLETGEFGNAWLLGKKYSSNIFMNSWS